MKMRGSKPDSSSSQKLLNKEVGWLSHALNCPRHEHWLLSLLFELNQDEDLKWVEENIPTTVADVWV